MRIVFIFVGLAVLRGLLAAFYPNFYTNLTCSKAFVILFVLEEALLYFPILVLNVCLCCTSLLIDPPPPLLLSNCSFTSEVQLVLERKRLSSMVTSEKRSQPQDQSRVSQTHDHGRQSHEQRRNSQVVVEVSHLPQQLVSEREMDLFLKTATETGHE